MVLVAGLGNPGRKYVATRHNVGFLALDWVAQHWSVSLNKHSFNAELGQGEIAKNKIILVKPQTFMNKSGESLVQFCEYYKIAPSQVIIIHDEIDLAFGDIREKHKGGTAGHNGVESIKALLGTDTFHRIRIGVGRPLDPHIDISDYVLNPFHPEELKKLPGIFAQVTALLEKYLADLT